MKSNHSPYLIHFLKKNDLFKELNDEELSALLSFIRIVHYAPGEWLMQEGESGQNLFIIWRGKAEILKKGEETKEPQFIGLLEPGDWVGEMAHLEKEKRSASIRALNEIDAIILLLEELSSSDRHQSIYSKISPHFAHRISQRLQMTDDQIIYSLNEKLELIQLNNQVGRTIIYMTLLFGVFLNAIAIYNSFAGSLKETINLIFTPIAFFLFGIGALKLIEDSGYSFAFYGLTFRRAGRVLFEAAAVSVPIMGLLTLFKWALITNITQYSTVPLLVFVRPGQTLTTVGWGILLFVGLVVIQELIVRGIFQSSFRNFFKGSNRVFYAILTSNLLFEVLHTGNDLFLALYNFIFGIFWGALFEYQKSLLGVILSHTLIGWWGIVALDLLSFAPSPTVP